MKFILILLILFIAYAIIENRFLLTIRTENFNNEINRLKIVHLSDLHKRSFGSNNQRLIDKVNAQNPDIIIFSGDFVTRDCTDFRNTDKFIRKLVNIAPVYYASGNHELDIMNSPARYSEFFSVLSKNGVHILDGKSEAITHNDRKIMISGTALKYSVYKKDGKYTNLDEYSTDELIAELGSPDKDFLNLLIAHNPFFAESYAEWGADYTFCGHVHGGAVMIPFVKIAILSPERKFLPKYAKGVFQIKKMKLLVSGGLGKLRLFNPPEIVVYYI